MRTKITLILISTETYSKGLSSNHRFLKEEVMMNNFLKFLTGLFYLAVPVVGWYFLYQSFKQVKPGNISMVNTWEESHILEPGIYFHPFPWESFSDIYSNALNFIDFGALIRVRILPGQTGVKVTSGNVYQVLKAGEHIIDISKGETFDPKKGIQNISGDHYTQGTRETFTITEGQVAVLNTRRGVEILNESGKHTIDNNDGNSLREILITGSQVVELPALTVMCSDQINMHAHAMLTYKIIDPIKTVSLGMEEIICSLKKLGDGSLRTILSRYQSSDVSPSMHHEEDHDSGKRISMLVDIHDQFVAELNKKAEEWGLSVSDLVITEILPADPIYKQTMQDIGTQRATAESKKQLSTTEAEINAINARAEQSLIIAAGKEQEEAMIRSKTAADQLGLETKAQNDKTISEAQAKAQAIELLATAEAKKLVLLSEAMEKAPEITKQLAFLEAQAKILGSNTVFVPQPELGHIRHYSDSKGTKLSIFSNGNDDASTTPIQSLVDLQAVNLTQNLVNQT
mgnify:FL=1|tara:strand:+ start:5438 stop:6982 length:1545 start_codon:yes stop_codon:yes gene_type:complete